MTADRDHEHADRAEPPLVWGHRGASAQARENTLAAFGLAVELGADGVELDARRTADGVLVVHHDPALPATGEWAGDHPGELLAGLPADALPPHVPTLADALALLCDAGLRVNVEIKCLPIEPDFDPTYRVVDDVVECLASVWPAEHRERLLVTSFDPAAVARVRDLAPGLPTGQLDARIVDRVAFVEAAAAAGHVAVHPWDPFVDEALVARAHELGLAVNPWTVDDPVRMAELAALGVDGIITNVVDVARATLTPPA